ncbi:hypothetical protein RIF29_13477 [Crotalaria pallida]|uniref:RING-type domain-containing protein n=1 Tax=Crotalaria pallida TaxID=3830 RepID=A0AAN9IP97_CROPI
MTKFLALVWSHIKWVLDVIIYYPFYKLHDSHMPIIREDVSTWHYETEEDVECAVCLCKIEEGEETRVLRCNHIFHKDCLDKWVGFNNVTCPLCRESVGPRRVVTDLGAEVLFFQFCSTHNNDERDTWWLR